MPGKNGFPCQRKNKKIDSLALYDLRRDPGERYNVIADNPEKVKELQNLAAKVRKDLGDALANVKGENRRPIGIIKN